MGKLSGAYSIKFLRITLGLFFVILGIIGIINEKGFSESIFELNTSSNMEAIFGFVEAVCGLILIGGLFFSRKKKVIYWTSIIVFLFWAARIVLSKFIWGLTINNNGVYPAGGFAAWLLAIAVQLVIASALVCLIMRYDNQ